MNPARQEEVERIETLLHLQDIPTLRRAAALFAQHLLADPSCRRRLALFLRFEEMLRDAEAKGGGVLERARALAAQDRTG